MHVLLRFKAKGKAILGVVDFFFPHPPPSFSPNKSMYEFSFHPSLSFLLKLSNSWASWWIWKLLYVAMGDLTRFNKPSFDLLSDGIFHLLWTARCSTGLNDSDQEKIEDRGWRISLDAVDTWNVMLWLLPYVPAISFNTQTYRNHQNIIY